MIPTEYYRTIRRNPSLVCYWRLRDTSGILAGDSSGRYLINGIYDGSPVSGPPLIYPAEGEIGHFSPASRIFGLSGQNVEIPNAAPLEIVSDITIEMWLIPRSLKVTCSVFNKMNSVSAPTHCAPYSFGLLAGAPSFSLGNGTTQVTLSSTTVLPVGPPVHVVSTCFKKTMKIIVNGTQVATTTLGSQEVKDLGKPVFLAAYPNNTERFNGLLAEVALYNGAMSVYTAKEHFSIGRQIISKQPYYTNYDPPSYS